MTNAEQVLDRIRAAGGAKEDIAMALVDFVTGLDPSVRQALEAVAIPHWFDANIISELLQQDKTSANVVFRKLCDLPIPIMVEHLHEQRWNVSQTFRSALRHTLAREQPARFLDLSARAADLFSADDPASRIEAIYHRLVASPELGIQDLEQLYEDYLKRLQRSRKLQRSRRRRVTQFSKVNNSTARLDAISVVLSELVTERLLTPFVHATALFRYTCIRRGDLSDAQSVENVQNAALLFHDTDHEFQELEARHMLAEILMGQGKREEALRELKECISIILRESFQRNAPVRLHTVIAKCTLSLKEFSQAYDVFLSYRSLDRETISKIACKLKDVGLRPWLDDWDMIQSKPFRPQLEDALSRANCTAVFVGPNGTGPWQERECDAALNMAVDNGRGIVITFLPGAPESVEVLPLFLRSYSIIRLGSEPKRGCQPGFSKLILAILGDKPGDLQNLMVDANMVVRSQSRWLNSVIRE